MSSKQKQSAALVGKATAATSIHPVLHGHAEESAARIPNGCYLTVSCHATIARPTVMSDPRMQRSVALVGSVTAAISIHPVLHGHAEASAARIPNGCYLTASCHATVARPTVMSDPLMQHSVALVENVTAATSIHPVLHGHAKASAARIPNGCYLTASCHATVARPTVMSDPLMQHIFLVTPNHIEQGRIESTQLISECGTGRESNCCDKHPSCASWASRGECSNNPEYMLPNCQLSCHSCETDNNETSDESSDTLKCGTGSQSNCCDKHPHCESWASEGQCNSNPSWMLPNCQFSCQDCENEPDEPFVDPELCGTGEKSDCCDFHASCPHWASVGECTRNRNYMHMNCMLSCNTCLTDPDPIVRQLAKRLGQFWCRAQTYFTFGGSSSDETQPNCNNASVKIQEAHLLKIRM
ncbi:shTK domain protein [Ancylostoma caninum]|uniref:ShTK domain protein n=1 Tax=Ancylostoma caninum TaxID=29170 RepID=A0A368H6P1_ANCCA|nr:shTK domain protein [Ancylostoma caninum]